MTVPHVLATVSLPAVEPAGRSRPPPADPARQAEERVAAAVRARSWRRRRTAYGLATVAAGVVVPVGSLSVAGSVSAGGFWNWIALSGVSPLLMTGIGGALAASLVFLRGWGVSLGMITFGVLFALLVAMGRAVLGELLPAMPGLVALFVATGALVGHLTVLEEGD
jgi:hypothetical protein